MFMAWLNIYYSEVHYLASVTFTQSFFQQKSVRTKLLYVSQYKIHDGQSLYRTNKKQIRGKLSSFAPERCDTITSIVTGFNDK